MDQIPATPADELPLAEELPADEPLIESHTNRGEPANHNGANAVTTPPDPSPHLHETSPVRLLLNLFVLFVSLFIFVRIFLLEPFGVPTGSMAPALIGNHRAMACPRCGFPVRVGAPLDMRNVAEQFGRVQCPNCESECSMMDSIDLNGDRLLVDKNTFNLRRPRRWEMAVFHCPDPDPKEYRKPYVKRVVGLPGETISIRDGDVFADTVLLRKTFAEVKETRVVVCDMAYVPNPGGWNLRWLVEPPENDPRLPPETNRPPEPADHSVLQGGEITLDAITGSRTSAGITYRHCDLDTRKEQPILVWNSYDGFRSGRGQLPHANDFSMSCEVEVLATSPEASFACRLFDAADAVHTEISVGLPQSGVVTLNHDGKGIIGTKRGASLQPGKRHRVEFSFSDRRAMVVLDGELMASADLPVANQRGPVRRPLQLGARGCRLVVRRLVLYRDIYYTQFGENGTQPPHGRPVTLGSNEYFMMGDNSGNSQDSRKWPNPGVPEVEFIGKPFLIHQPLRAAQVKFGGRERVFQTVDWSRMRWLH